MNGLDLFSGIGGISLALAPWVTTVAYCEIDPFARGVLLSRMADGGLQHAPIWDDVTTLRAEDFGDERIDIVTGGFPCQDLSVAGSRRGLDGERSGLYREIIRLVSELRPSFVFLENVPAIRKSASAVVGDLAALGYDSRWTTLSASDIGAPHKRERWWCLAANPDCGRFQIERERHDDNGSDACWDQPNGLDAGIYWQENRRPFPAIRRVDDGLPSRVDRLRALGNAVCPPQARVAFEILSGLSPA